MERHKFLIKIMSKPQPTIIDPQWQSGLPENLSVKTSDVLGYDLDKDMNEDIQPKVKTVGNQSSVDNSQRKHEQQTNSVENEKGDAFDHESHDFQKQRFSPSHFTGGEKSELEKKDDEATMELIHRPKENKGMYILKFKKKKTSKDDKNATSLPRKPVNDNKSCDENKDSKEKGHFNLSNEKPKSDPSIEGKEHSEKVNDRSAVENDHKKESDSDDSENSFGQQKECSGESKPKNVDNNCNSSDDKNKGFKEHKSITSAHNKKEDGKDNQTLAGRVQNTGVDVDASKANTKDVGFESKKNYTNRKSSSPSPKEDTRNDDNSEKTQAAMQSGRQPKTQQKNDFTSSSDDSDQEIDSSNQRNDRKTPDKIQSKSNENYQGSAENTGDTVGDLDPSKVSKNDSYDANNCDASENSTTKNPKSANAGQKQEDNRNHPATAHKTQQKNHNDVKNEGDKEVQPKSHRSDSAKIVENPENETLADRVRDFGVDIDASKANTFGPKDLGFLKDDKNEDPNIKAKKSGDNKNQKNESSIPDTNESAGKNEDQNSIKQWIENLVTNDKPKSDDSSNDLIDNKKGREVQNKSSAENKKSDSS
uniref:Dentin sialophosphoprotein-like n=1 Tax=Panagrolaimus davidi TaxID=227884 RepID=A0A914QML4_9BILA